MALSTMNFAGCQGASTAQCACALVLGRDRGDLAIRTAVIRAQRQSTSEVRPTVSSCLPSSVLEGTNNFAADPCASSRVSARRFAGFLDTDTPRLRATCPDTSSVVLADLSVVSIVVMPCLMLFPSTRSSTLTGSRVRRAGEETRSLAVLGGPSLNPAAPSR
ncbi:hypothetical protein DFH07DRAFT_230534 [Mycena maculata]|uniref:Uncharacterized protein n=1 Tax=Mycena maculata TaxID=230809 RepID=A0AAD7HUA5_9AGAR|nr:hypothetical protein DFH07DRAFT_230534 [Mycena maculata]